ncbi:glycoside hydrolase family 13 domain protein [Gemmatirosa kalamazoonensis]|uniref:Glycoside hydrolase family 13 domain protein n=1 Tax=Gemmatirosa kalamazoonensis TaxID=861299 RepID=W0RHG2_9BACT|nr:isoamylase early set domain-containing protein [Gemmatirosa kalamazoonensis]AHG88843.1 glycoside hydrolase family 13 domain protein [Gemmatirosa kalamazoonensis]
MTGPSSFDDGTGLERVTDALRRLPPADPRAVDRVVSAALARRQTRARQRTWLARAAGLALAVGLAGGGVWFGRREAASGTTTATASTATTDTAALPPTTPAAATGNLRLATAGRSDDTPVAVAFALRRPGARRVSLVGDFDEWSPAAVPMRRAADGTWTTTVTLAPGRHAYAFVVDDSVWVTDPSALVVRDPDYGRDHSVIVVGQP